jgi:iron complex outermembrane receptor protein
MKKKLITLAACAAVNPVWGDDLGTIVVSAARTEQSEINTPASITVIGRKEIENSSAQNVAEVLRARGGVNITDLYGDGSRFSVDMRGFGEAASRNTLILVDGRRLNNIDNAAPFISSISLRDVERIEIMQGSAGTLFGDQAVGGVINIITRRPDKFSGQVEAGVGSYNRRQLFANIGDAMANGIDYRLSGEFVRSDNYRQHNEVERRNLLGTAGYRYRTGRVFVDLQNFYEDLNTPGSLLPAEAEQDPRQSLPEFSGDYIKTWNNVGRIGLNQGLGKHWHFEGEYTYRDEKSDIVQSFRGFQVTDVKGIERERQELTPRFIGFYNNRHGEMQFTVGYDYADTDYLSEITSKTDRQKVKGLYAQGVIPFSTSWTLTLGGRSSDVENDYVDNSFTGSGNNERFTESVKVWTMGLQYRPTDAWRLFLRRDGNFRYATVDEFTYTSPGDELKTQTGVSYEFGSEWLIAGYRAKALLYRIDLENEIAYDPSATPPTGAFFPGANVNFDPTTHQGLILEADHQLTQNFRIGAAYSYVNAQFDSGIYAGKTISGVPRDTFKVMTDYDFARDWHWFFEGNYTGKQFLAGDNANALGWQSGYTVLNTALDYRWKGLKISGRINNLANKKYAEAANSFGSVYPMPGRNYMLTASYNF